MGTGRFATQSAAGGQDGELDLSADDSLPWLESDADEDGSGGVDTAQVIGFGLVLLAVLALVVGAVWYFSRAGSSEFEPDGSIIAAPDGPIKVRPDDPGGKEFAGTGNVAPVVGEGGVRESRVAVEDVSEARAGDDGAQAEGQKPAAEASGITDQGADRADEERLDGVAVQLAAYRSRERARRGWRELRARTDVLNGVSHRIVRGVVDIGTVYRLQAIAPDRSAGDALCDALKADGLDCQVKS